MKRGTMALIAILGSLAILCLVMLVLISVFEENSGNGSMAGTASSVSYSGAGMNSPSESGIKLGIEGSSAGSFEYPEPDILTPVMNNESLRAYSDAFDNAYEIGPFVFNTYSGTVPVRAGSGAWAEIGEDEWFLYGLAGTDTFDCFSECIKGITGESAYNAAYAVKLEGFLGYTPGKYIAGTVLSGGKEYYLLAYFIDGGQACGYMTSSIGKLKGGYGLLTEGIRTMLYDDSVIEGTGLEEYAPVDRDDPYIMELMGGAKYSSVTVNKDFERMRVIFKADGFENIRDLYMRRGRDGSIIYPSEYEYHEEDEAVFVVDDVEEGEEFKIVVFADGAVSGLRACAVEYEDSEAVKNASYNE